MAVKTFYATKPFKFANRMMRPGETVAMDAPTARLYLALKAISDAKPKAAKAYADPAQFVAPEGAAVQNAAAPKPKPAPRKRTTKKRATAKK